MSQYSIWYVKEMERKFPFMKHYSTDKKNEFIKRNEALDYAKTTLHGTIGSSHSDFLDREWARDQIEAEWETRRKEYLERTKAREKRHSEYLERQRIREQRTQEKQQKHEEYLQRKKVREEREATKQKREHERKERSQRTVFVKNLSFRANNEDLSGLFSESGNVQSIVILTDQLGKSRGLATIVYSSRDEANKALTLFNNQMFKGRKLTVQIDKYSVNNSRVIRR